MDVQNTLTLAMPRFLRRCDAVSTRVAYKRELRRFLNWLPTDPTEETLFDYRDHLRQKNLGATTIRWRTTVVRSFLQFAKRRGFLDYDMVADFKPPKGKRGFAPRVLTQSELDQLIKSADRRTIQGRRNAAVLVCMGVGGLRVGEVCALDVQDVIIRPDEVLLTVHGKGNKERSVKLSGPYVKLFLGYINMLKQTKKPWSAFFWCGGKKGHRITRSTVRYIVTQAASEADLPRLNPHALRHTAATLEIATGVSLPEVQALLGHASILTTIKYLHLR